MTSLDEFYMLKAIAAGEKARIQAPPNPWVGCLIVKDNQILSEGCTQPVGGPHAEVQTLSQTQAAEGSTVYVTLEPCHHYGKTPPCTKALIEAKVKRVVVSIEDPDSKVQGKGMQALKEAGIEVIQGICQAEAKKSLEPYLFQRTYHRPFCLCKAAISIDGKIAAQNLSSQWITTAETQAYTHHLRASSQAIIIGAGTANQDQPQLTVRQGLFPPKPPLRVILDSQGWTVPQGPLFDAKLGPTLIYTTEQCPDKIKLKWEQQSAQVVTFASGIQGKVPLDKILQDLSSRGVIQALIEGGASILSSFIQEKFCNQLTLLVGSKILGANGLSVFSDIQIADIQSAIGLNLKDCNKLGNNALLNYTFP